ncbi:MAG: uroporphyrinogen-III synthase, partial [Actinomycetota bacterium]|nr:uroporphyrinogen-III synthase [Actinomycetota bacterium]
MRAISLRTAVTTSPDRAPAMAKELERVGLHPVVLPCLEVHPAGPGTLERARRAAEEADLLVLTSARVLGLLWPDGGFPATPVAAVGRSTAEGVRARGGR